MTTITAPVTRTEALGPKEAPMTTRSPIVGDRVSTEWGGGVVADLSSRRIVVALDSGETLNVVVGTPGFFRITVEA